MVIIRAYGGQPLIRRIWDFNNKVVFVTDDLIEGIISLGFPRENVFKHDHKLASSMERNYKQGKWDWNRLIPF